MRKCLEHNSLIKEKLSSLSLFQCTLFFSLTCERQLPVYAKFSLGKPWSNFKALRLLLDECWDWSISHGKGQKPFIPTADNFIEITSGQAGAGHALYPYYSIEDLVKCIANQVVDPKANPANNAITIIDSYLYDTEFESVTKKNDALVDEHPLMVNEIRYQIANINAVSNKNWVAVDWQKEKNKVIGKSILNL